MNQKYSPKNFNIDRIRGNNVNSMVQIWYDLLLRFGIDTGDIDPMLYAIELQYRNHNRYGSQRLPNINNVFAGRFYGSLLPPYYDSNPFREEWSAENQEKQAKEMLEYLIYKSIKPETVLKWQKPEVK